MSDNNADAVITESDATIMANALGAFYPELDDGTTIRFKVKFDDDDGSKTYNYAAIFTNGKWYTTGVSTAFPRDVDTVDLFRAMAKFRAFDIELATEFETVR